jgi:hypothetical protein
MGCAAQQSPGAIASMDRREALVEDDDSGFQAWQERQVASSVWHAASATLLAYSIRSQ